jgi:integration host factor subunit alpha
MTINPKKDPRIGRNAKIATGVAISPHRVVVFKPSPILMQRINGPGSGGVA